MVARQTLGIRAIRTLEATLAYGLLTLGSVFMLLPLYWLIATSLKTPAQVQQFPPEWIPSSVTLQAYREIFSFYPWNIYIQNTLIISAGVMIGTLLSCSIVAYGFAFFRFRGRETIFFLVLSTMMLPGIVRIVPLYIAFSKLGWINTFLPLIVPAFFGTPFYIFLLRQFFRTIPNELLDAAIIDGCSELGILWRIIAPLSKTAIAVIALFTFQNTWDDFLQPLIYLQQSAKYTVALGVYSLHSAPDGTISIPQVMAGASIMVIPVIIIFALFQRYFIQGIALTGVKG
jgi:ABC-type glycerol-3-phosphate transport system permease component